MTTEGNSARIPTVLVLLMLLTMATAVIEWPNFSPTVDIEYGPEMEGTSGSEVSSMPMTSSRLITIANITSFEGWWRHDYSTYTSFGNELNVPLLNVTEIRMGLAFSLRANTSHMALFGWWADNSEHYFAANSSALVAGNHSLTIEFPWMDSHDYKWFRQADIVLYLSDGPPESIELERFWIQVAVSSSVCSLTLNIERTNGEDLYSSPFAYQLSYGAYGPRVRFNYDNFSIYYIPTRQNDTILLPAGYLAAQFEWAHSPILVQNFTAQLNQSIFLLFTAQFVRLDVTCDQRVPNLSFEILYYVGYYGESGSYAYDHILAYSATFFYLSSNMNISVSVREHDESLANFRSTINVGILLPKFYAGLTRNITLTVHPNWIQIGSILINPGKLVSLVSFVVVILVSSLSYKSRVLKSRTFIPWLLLALSFFLPWLSSFEHPTFSLVAREPYTTYAIGSPTFGTLIYNNDSNVVLMAYDSDSYRGDLLAILLLWTAFVMIFIWTARNLDGYDSKGLARAAGIGIILCCIIEFVCLTLIYQTHYYYDYELKLEIGPFLSLLAVVLWFLLPRITRGFDDLKIPIQSTKTRDD